MLKLLKLSQLRVEEELMVMSAHWMNHSMNPL